MVHITGMEDGGLFGGWEHIAWFSQRLHSFTGNTWIYILTTCFHQFKTMFPGRGNIYDIMIKPINNLKFCSYHLFFSMSLIFLNFNFVASNRTCEDIAMSFIVANATGAPPIWVKGTLFFFFSCCSATDFAIYLEIV